jgi:hypothetical protein
MLIFYNKHYPNAGFIHKWFIYSAVNIKAGLSAIGKLVGQNTSKRNDKEHIYTTEDLSYQEIIADMNKNSGKKTLYKIMNHQTGIIIAPNEIITKKER